MTSTLIHPKQQEFRDKLVTTDNALILADVGAGARPAMASAAARIGGDWIIIANPMLHQPWASDSRDEGLKQFWLFTPYGLREADPKEPPWNFCQNVMLEFTPAGKMTARKLPQLFKGYKRVWLRPIGYDTGITRFLPDREFTRVTLRGLIP